MLSKELVDENKSTKLTQKIMGIFNWLLKNGPGSPGSTAKLYIKEYKKLGVINHNEEWQGAFYSLFMQRFLANQKLGFPGGSLLNKVEVKDVVDFSEGDLGLFVFYMMLLETSNFRNNISITFNDVTEVIYNAVKDEVPSVFQFNLNEFRLRASSL